MKNLQTIVSQFAIKGNVVEVRPFGNGLINDSYLAKTEADAPDYLLQRINHRIFSNVDMLQNNIAAVTAHIRTKLAQRGEQDIDRKTLTIIPARDGKKYCYDGENYWRMLLFISNSVSCEKVDARSAGIAGQAFGDFQSMLADLPNPLGEIIPNFHNMEFRISQLQDAIKANPSGRAASVQNIIDEVESRRTQMCRAEQWHRDGKLPKRVCHCDTKVNNILFDSEGRVLCVIDLDTVMPSYIFSDVGDFLRTSANTGAEDDRNLDNVNFNMDIFRSFAQAYLGAAKGFLTDIEKNNLPYAAALFPYMQCVRFLADYINGDVYYKIQYPEHNLVRTLAQFKLLQSVEQNTPAMEQFIAGIK